MARVGNLFTVRGQLGALIRVYCDNDARWQLKPDRPDDPDPNSQRGNPNQQEWIDPSNHLSHIGPTCATNPLMVARTYKTPYDDADGDNDFENRVTITVIDQGSSPRDLFADGI